MRGVLWARKRQPDEVAYGLALVEENYTDPVSGPAEVGPKGSEVSDMKFKTMGLISPDPA